MVPAKVWLRVQGLPRSRWSCPSSLLLAVCRARSGWPEARLARVTGPTRWIYFGSLRNHAAFEHFVGDGCRYFVDKCRAHLLVGFQHVQGFLFHLRFRSFAFLRPLLPQLLEGRCLVLFD